MIDTTQLLLIIVVSVLTILLTIIGIQIFFILKEFRKSVQKMNKILDDTGRVSGTVADQVSHVSGLVSGLAGSLSIFNFLRRKKE